MIKNIIMRVKTHPSTTYSGLFLVCLQFGIWACFQHHMELKPMKEQSDLVLAIHDPDLRSSGLQSLTREIVAHLGQQRDVTAAIGRGRR